MNEEAERKKSAFYRRCRGLLGDAEHRLLGRRRRGAGGRGLGRTGILVVRLHEPFPDVRRLRHKKSKNGETVSREERIEKPTFRVEPRNLD